MTEPYDHSAAKEDARNGEEYDHSRAKEDARNSVESFADMPAEADAAERDWRATQTVERYAAVLRWLAENGTPEARDVLLGALDVCERGDFTPPDGAT